MAKRTFLSISQQATTYLRGEILQGRWQKTMPGRQRLADELGINEKTVEAALNQLEAEGILENQGSGRRRKIVPYVKQEASALRLAFLEFSPQDKGDPLMLAITQRLQEAGHAPFYIDKTLAELNMNPTKVARAIKNTEADAWIIYSASQEILEWFSKQNIPSFAVFGRFSDLPIAGVKPDRSTCQKEITRHLIELGHRRISFLCRHHIRQPTPAIGIRAFLDELESYGIETGAFHLPEWEESSHGFIRILDSLCVGPTPATALFLDEPFLYHAAYQHLARRGLRIPEDVSLICTDACHTFAWCQPSVAHIQWESRPVVRRIVRWANNIARGKVDRRQSFTKASFVNGGSIGPVSPSPPTLKSV